jgi:hypothetical protein
MNSKAKIFMYLSEWDKLNHPKQQIKAGKRINKKKSKRAMPPSGFLNIHPEGILIAEQIKSLSSGSNSLKKY